MLQLKYERPPKEIYDQIVKVYGDGFDKGTIYTYGDTVYTKNKLPQHLIIHEGIHVQQQSKFPGGKEAWWHKYFTNKNFVLDQELEAYRAQYKFAVLNLFPFEAHDVLRQSVMTLSGPVYKHIITEKEAAYEITKGL